MCFSLVSDFHKHIRLPFILLLFFSPYGFSLEQGLPKVNSTKIIIEQFEIRPLICITQMLGNNCELKIKLNWRSNINSDFCVYQETRLIKCWENARQGQHKETLTLIKNTRFSLRLEGNQVILAQQNIKINYTHSDTHRRRLRSQWSIF
ncbi:DUF3019 domain-containing protein [Psychrosphaera sp. F3M07]|uniref:DUF3019 domain-containing protein n=1 Tax=Psychrosphaera sp. F3M07 TaxID=2841560 RepID=UPI001C08F010|nr:DUF3019 domain-containing protein [Psychrosphaera sp. F3M07]MBU2917813.1 DUF3019 domain-containing protein [Psychrosphaera sp. F3M07]